jgi:hypothetical protein
MDQRASVTAKASASENVGSIWVTELCYTYKQIEIPNIQRVSGGSDPSEIHHVIIWMSESYTELMGA